MTSLQDLLPHPGSRNWRKSRSLTTDSEEELTVVRHIVIREVWLEKRPWPHAVYKIDVMSQTSHWFVFKRYKEFYQLHQKLVKLYSVPRDLLPPRKIANNMARENLESRRESLEHYLQKLLNSCNGAVRRSEELSEFLDVKSHDVQHVTYDLAKYVQKNGQSILMSKEMFNLSPSQLYCISKQLQLPHPSGRKNIDLGNLYEFVADLKKLSITDFISQMSNGEQHEISFTFDLSIFSSLRVLQMDAIDIESLRGFETLCSKLNKLTARYCLSSMKSLLIDAALEKRSAPQVSLSAESWRVHAAYRLAENRVKFQPWHALTNINFSHNNITTFDSSMTLLPALKYLDLSNNKISHFDLEQLTCSCLHTLSLASNSIYLISGTTKPIDNLKNLNLTHNKIHSMEGLLCCQGLEELNLTFNKIALIGEVKKLASLTKLTSLSVDGNYFAMKKRHRIIIFAYFRERQLHLDKRPITQKEQAKLDAKFAALERFEDMDDSLSSISTVSDDSDVDSGIDHSNWVSKLASLSEIEEDDHEVIPRINWEEVYVGGSKIENESETSSQDDAADAAPRSNDGEVLSRDDWDRILKTSPQVLGARPREDSNGSGNTLKENSLHSTVCAENVDDLSTWVNTGAVPKRFQHGGRSREREHIKVSTQRSKSAVEVRSKERTSSWMSNLFRRSKTPTQSGQQSNSLDGEKLVRRPVDEQVTNENNEMNEGDLIVIPEIDEVKVEEKDVSRSFDDNCEFEKAEECDEIEETGHEIENID
ncbi:nischarin-like [Hydractinia symbiolongicarpus]|uniref:nischarin-like n=1 Tax=Hydractinia symbiolongicarpus TaxID=13093 RepID=UPI00254DB952|nr:nischarin-like [Hydractinia symbiolongicarpus]